LCDLCCPEANQIIEELYLQNIQKILWAICFHSTLDILSFSNKEYWMEQSYIFQILVSPITSSKTYSFRIVIGSVSPLTRISKQNSSKVWKSLVLICLRQNRLMIKHENIQSSDSDQKTVNVYGRWADIDEKLRGIWLSDWNRIWKAWKLSGR
jgi:hypothetical protein